MDVLKNLELLLSQEMESIKGGAGSGVCLCISAAAQLVPSCSCDSAAGQVTTACSCKSGANQANSQDNPSTCTTATN